VRIPVEITVPVEKTLSGPGITSIPIEGSVLPRASVRAIKALTDRSRIEYLALARGSKFWSVQLLSPKDSQRDAKTYTVAAETRIPAVQGEIKAIQRLDVNQDGLDDYVIVYRLPGASGAVSVFRFQYLDWELRPLVIFDDPSGPTNIQDYDNQLSPIPEAWAWLKIQSGRRARLVPAWISRGAIPKSEYPPFDPRESDIERYMKTEFEAPRFYYLGFDGIHTVDAGKEDTDYSLFQILPQSDDERAKGVVPVLMGRAHPGQENDFMKDFALAKVKSADDKTPSVSDIIPISQEYYRTLIGLNNVLEISSLSSNPASPGVTLSGPSTPGTVKTSWLVGGKSLDTLERPLNELDSVMLVSGAYQGAKTVSAFVQTHYELQYHDFVRDQVTSTSLNRYSFMPRYKFNKTFFPAVASTKGEKERTPAIFIPAGLAESLNTEVILPKFAADGSTLGLWRPASLRLELTDDCNSLDTPEPADATSTLPTQMIFFCGDRFLRIPLTY
jgi:hypothetical protein